MSSAKLFAISDVHVRHPDNRAFIETLEPHPEDWLVLGGDIGEEIEDLELVVDTLSPRFAQIVWVPGNHELWTLPRSGAPGLRGEAKYARLVERCRRRGVITPEDPYPILPVDGPPTVIAPMFLLYDYSFRPPEITREGALAWALEHDIMCTDEELLHPAPYESKDAWCAARVEETERRLSALPEHLQTVLVNHFPLRRAHARLPLVPRFSIWCGTQKTDDWHLRFRARAVVYGHLHIPRTHIDDGVPFEEVSLGYPRQRAYRRPGTALLRQILPRP